MAQPIRSNMFNVGSRAQRYFSRFPMELRILFPPTKPKFKACLADCFGEFDSILNKATPEGQFATSKFRRAIERELDGTESVLSNSRHCTRVREQTNTGARLEEGCAFPSSDGAGRAIDDVAGHLAAPASVTPRFIDDRRRAPDLVESLNGESPVISVSAVCAGSFLETLANTSLQGLGPLIRCKPKGGRNRNRKDPLLEIGFTSGTRKAFRRKVNLSLEQSARHSCHAPKSEPFAQMDFERPWEQGRVITVSRLRKPVFVDVEQANRDDHARVSKTMSRTSGQELDAVVTPEIGKPVAAGRLDNWRI